MGYLVEPLDLESARTSRTYLIAQTVYLSSLRKLFPRRRIAVRRTLQVVIPTVGSETRAWLVQYSRFVTAEERAAGVIGLWYKPGLYGASE